MKLPPKIKIDYYFKEIAKELNLPVEDVESIYRHYRKHVEDEFKTKAIIDLYKLGKLITSPVLVRKDWERITKNIIYDETLKPEAVGSEIYNSNVSLQKKLEDKIEKISTYEKYHTVKEHFEESSSNFRRDYKEHLERRVRGEDSRGETGDLSPMPEELRECEEGWLQDTEN